MSISTASSSIVAAGLVWTDLHPDIIDIVVHYFDDIVDFVNFGATCRAWRSIALTHLHRCCCRRESSSQIPWLLFLRPRIEQIALPTKKMGRGLASTVPPLRFYNFSTKKNYFFNHPPHLKPDIDRESVKLMGSYNGYLIYKTVDRYFVKFHFSDDFRECSSEYNILYFYNPVSGIYISLPPAPIFDGCKVIIKKNPLSDNFTVAAICYDDDDDDPNRQRICIDIIQTGDSEWTHLNLSKIITDDSIEDIVFHQGRLYAITCHLKTLIFVNIHVPTFFSEEIVMVKCVECPSKELLEEAKDEITERKLIVSPDGKDLFLHLTCMAHLGTNEIGITFKLFKHDWGRGQWDLVKCPIDHDISFFKSFDMLSVAWKSQSHLIANRSTINDPFTGYDVGDGCKKRLNIPDNVEWAPYLWFIPNLS